MLFHLQRVKRIISRIHICFSNFVIIYTGDHPNITSAVQGKGVQKLTNFWGQTTNDILIENEGEEKDEIIQNFGGHHMCMVPGPVPLPTPRRL